MKYRYGSPPNRKEDTNTPRRRAIAIFLAIFSITPTVSRGYAIGFSQEELELVKQACLAGSSYGIRAAADGSVSVKKTEGKGELRIRGERVDTVDLPDSEKKQEFTEIRDCIKTYLIPKNQDGEKHKKTQETKARTRELFPAETDYRKIASPALGSQLIGKTISFRAVFLGEWNTPLVYKLAGIPSDNVVFINHCDITYNAAENALRSTESEIPNFPVSIESTRANEIYSLNKDDVILIVGKVRKPNKTSIPYPFDFARIYIEVQNIKDLTAEEQAR